MGRGFFIFVLVGALFASCGKGTVMPDSPAVPDKDSLESVPAGALLISLDGNLQRISLQGSASDTLLLQEEGLRKFEIIGYEPEGAVPPVIDAINFYRDVYSFNYTGDSIYILGGSNAAPLNHYLSFTGNSFNEIVGKKVTEVAPVHFHNYVNRSYDKTSVEIDGKQTAIWWRDLGKLRRYRIEIILRQQGENKFTIPFYEKENKVNIPDTIDISPGDTLQLGYQADAPAEFNIFEWARGNAYDALNPLNAKSVEKAFNAELENPLLTEEGKRYTFSKVHLSPAGLLTVDADWDPAGATAAGGAIYNSIPICIIFMPQGNPIVQQMKRTFRFPDGKEIVQYPTPFYSNAVVRINAL